jgi:hypothetical protein
MARKSKPLPSVNRLNEMFVYEPKLGFLSARFSCADRIRFFELQGGYVQVLINGEAYLAHRIIWKMMKGYDPIEVDHEDTDPGNNKWSNLREATSAEQNRNRKLSIRNKTGVKGVCWESARCKWRATIGSDNPKRGYILLWIKRFDDFDDAVQARAKALHEFHDEFARTL